METFLKNKPLMTIGAFKSYYVVWKRFAGRDKTQGKNSLNRTM